MAEVIRPAIVVSKCLGFAACRYNGVTIADEFVRHLQGHVDFLPVCPECEIGLGCPREPIRIVRGEQGERLLQPATGREVTSEMVGFSGRFLDGLAVVDGFILKHKSPSCGIANVKLFAAVDAKGPCGRTAGFFGQAVKERFCDLAVEDEGRLHSFAIREHFLTRVWAMARWRAAAAAGEMGRLVEFHSRHKLLLMLYSQVSLRKMGRTVANHAHRPLAEVLGEYGAMLRRALARPPRFTAAINVLMHALGYFSEKLTPAEKAHFLDTLSDYRRERLPLSAPVAILRSWIARFGESYLAEQLLFAPYPAELVQVTDSGKGRDYS